MKATGGGYNVITAVNVDGEEGGLAKFKRFQRKIDVVVTDLSMKGRSGYTLISDLRDKIKTDVPIIMHTTATAAGDEYREEAMDSGANGFLNKQDGLKVLMAEIERVIAEKGKGQVQGT